MNNDFAAKRDPVAQIDVQQKIDRAEHTIQLHAFNARSRLFVRADADKDRFVSLTLQVFEQKFPAQFLAETDSTPSDSMALISAWMISRGSRYSGTPSTNIPPATSCASNTVAEETQQRQFVRARQSCGPGADDGDLRRRQAAYGSVAERGVDAVEIELVRLDAELFADKPFQGRGIETVASSVPADRLRTGGTDPAADRGKRFGHAGIM